MSDEPIVNTGAVRRLLGDLEVAIHQSAVADAVGWVVVVTDDEFGRLVHAEGLYPTPEAALIEAGRRHAEDVRMNPAEAAAGHPLWTYTVLPMFAGGIADRPAGSARALVGPLPRDPGRCYCECGAALEWNPYLLAYRDHLCEPRFRL